MDNTNTWRALYEYSNHTPYFCYCRYNLGNSIIIMRARCWKIQCKMPPKTKRFYPLVPK